MGCQAPQPKATFDADWEFIVIPGYPVRACLGEDKVIELKKVLNRCEVKEEAP